MAKVIVIAKAILTRIIFATHGFVAIWRVTTIKNDPYYWYLASSILALFFEGTFTLTIKKNQEWKWFCPSVFFYLCSVVPAIWIIEVDKFDTKFLALQDTLDKATNGTEQSTIQSFGMTINVPIKITAETWATVIEQLLMLILIIGRWMLPKGGLTRDQLSQLLLVYIGTAADIIEFFDSFKDDKISSQRVLCLMILSIWSWSLLQFTFVLTATKARRTRITTDIQEAPPKAKFKNGILKVKKVCCSIDVWAILINIILQDAPFLVFRMLLISYYKIISYMNIFFTCKNTLVIILQFYRLFVVQIEKKKEIKKMKQSACGSLMKAIGQNSKFGQLPERAGNSKRVPGQPKPGSSSRVTVSRKHQSQDSISSQQRCVEAIAKNRLRGRRKSLSTGNLRSEVEGCAEVDLFEGEVSDDELELADPKTARTSMAEEDFISEDEFEAAPDYASLSFERPRTQRKIRLSENPGVYRISGSRSSGASSERNQNCQYRQDTGYSSSSKESGNSCRNQNRVRAYPREVSRSGRSGGGRSNNINENTRSYSAAAAGKRRRHMMDKQQSHSIERIDCVNQGRRARALENERI